MGQLRKKMSFCCCFPFALALSLSSCPGAELVVLLIVFCQGKAYGVHLYTIIYWGTGCHGNLRLVLPFIPQALLY